jgi:hypothetical protein
MTQAVKPVSKYKKHASKAFQFPLRNDAITCFIVFTPDCVVCTFHVSKGQKKAANGTRLERDAYGLAALPLCRFSTGPAPRERLAPLAR